MSGVCSAIAVCAIAHGTVRLRAHRTPRGVGPAGGRCGPASAVDPGMEALVRAFFATQEAEDVAGYLALWSRTAARPSPAMLKFVFDSGDDRYSDISILRVDATGAVTRVRVAATRDRTVITPGRTRRRPPTAGYVASLLMVKEDGEWRLVARGLRGRRSGRRPARRRPTPKPARRCCRSRRR